MSGLDERSARAVANSLRPSEEIEHLHRQLVGVVPAVRLYIVEIELKVELDRTDIN